MLNIIAFNFIKLKVLLLQLNWVCTQWTHSNLSILILTNCLKKNIKLTAFSTQSRTNNVGDAIILTDVSIWRKQKRARKIVDVGTSGGQSLSSAICRHIYVIKSVRALRKRYAMIISLQTIKRENQTLCLWVPFFRASFFARVVVT